MFIGYYNLANLITLLGLTSSVASCFFAISGAYHIAVIFLVFSGVCDVFDGAVARMLKRSEASRVFGVQIDTVCDMVSFGVTPAVILYSMGFRDPLSCLALGLLVLCAAIRLAYFNTMVITSDMKEVKTYIGLPVPFSAAILPPALLLRGCISQESFQITILTITFVIAVAYISKFKLPKLHGTIYILYPLYTILLVVLYLLYGGALHA